MTESFIETTSHGKCLMIRGFRFPPGFNPEFVCQALDYKPRAGDVFVSTYIKCGTTWVQYVVWCLHNLDKLASGEGVPTLTDLLHKHVPMIDWVGTEPLAQLPEPRLMKHHLPFHMAPYHPEAKYVVVVRNPFDSAVSFYHMRKRNWLSAGLSEDYKFDAFFESFMTGDVPYGSYFDHILSWYEHRNDPNVHLLYFEHLLEDTAAEVLKIADFVNAKEIGSRLRSDPGLLEKVVEKTSFTSLKKTAVPDEDVDDKDIGDWENPKGPSRNFFRKGVVGDWKNQLSADQERRLKELYLARLGGTELQKVWEKYLGF
ncbi:sulfotransferase 1C2-like [Ornithodoros turicata]|uniref:sulfotransferase 1C2-like n=1 Tax=Ornithodoros turicata TaxID=34597 RepID=UPI003138963D